MCGTVGRLGLHPSTQSVVILIPRGIGLDVTGMLDCEGFCVCYDGGSNCLGSILLVRVSFKKHTHTRTKARATNGTKSD